MEASLSRQINTRFCRGFFAIFCLIASSTVAVVALPASAKIDAGLWFVENYGEGRAAAVAPPREPAFRSRRQTSNGSTVQCEPSVSGIRILQSGSVPALREGAGGGRGILAEYEPGDASSLSAVVLTVYGNCLEAVEEVALTAAQSCDTRIGPFPLDPDVDSAASPVRRTFRLDLNNVRTKPRDGIAYSLCVGSNTQLYLQKDNSTQVAFHVKPVPTEALPLWAKILLVIVLLCFSGLFSGLNLGLMSLDPVELQVVMQSGSEKEKKYAKRIEPVRRKGNYLLCTILLGNVLVNATLTNFLDDLTGSGLVAIVASSGGIVILGEIVPQSFCSRHGLAVGARTIYLTYFFMVVTFPLAFPISFILDKILGQEIGRVFKREELMKLVELTKGRHDMADDEVEMLAGVLEFKKKTVDEVMTPKADMFLLSEDAVLNFDTLHTIQQRGHSRIPVHAHDDVNDILGVMFVKDLMFVDPDDNWPVSRIVKVYRHPVLRMDRDTKLDVALENFKSGVSHMSLVREMVNIADRDPWYETIGIVTLEDIIEEIIKAEIVDETDIIRDNVTKEPVLRESDESNAVANVPIQVGGGGNGQIHVSKHLMMAASTYMRTDLERLFSPRLISDDKLTRLLANPSVTCTLRLTVQQKSEAIVHRRRDLSTTVEIPQDKPNNTADSSNMADNLMLYNAGVRSDYFILILEGRVEVRLRQFEFEHSSFYYFGAEVLEKKAAFVPDFSVHALTDLIYVKIPLSMYQTACQFSQASHASPLSARFGSGGSGCALDSLSFTGSAGSATQGSTTGTRPSNNPGASVTQQPTLMPPRVTGTQVLRQFSDDFVVGDKSPLITRGLSTDGGAGTETSPKGFSAASKLSPRLTKFMTSSSGGGYQQVSPGPMEVEMAVVRRGGSGSAPQVHRGDGSHSPETDV